MKPYAPPTNKGRTVAVDDVHHKTADQPRYAASKAAKKLRHAARQHQRAFDRAMQADDERLHGE